MTAAQTLLLLDVDGVLVHPVGYKAALRATIDRVATVMGQPGIELSDDEIAVFEACGITNEWDSSAICVSALVMAALAAQPDLRRDTLNDTLDAVRTAGLNIARPDFVEVARTIAARNTNGQIPALVYLEMAAERAPAADVALISTLLADIYTLDTLTTRVFQTHTLGSARFLSTYGVPAPFESESYLSVYDVSLLSAAHRAALLRWQSQPGSGAAIFTARPSLPPPGTHLDPLPGYAPEAELALELLDLDGALPLIASGRVGWIAAQYGRAASDYIKPAPVQALAAIGAAACGDERAALQAAATLAEKRELTGPLADLAGQQVRVIVFEDAPTGVRAARLAVDRLREAGLDIALEAVGVSPQRDKRAALAAVSKHVVDDINAGLALALDLD
jgi:hypothetical protein